ncbi:DUF4256 domain-containing protein [Undibacterium baiyunense]|nr:DUF4256 domain-containing protein [Undibacterium baiyunense]
MLHYPYVGLINMKNSLNTEAAQQTLSILEKRFAANPHRHPNIDWQMITLRLKQFPEKLASLAEMEKTGGEPDVFAYDATTDTYYFCDCSIESPTGRRSVCYDLAALQARKEHQPHNSAVEMATAMGVELMNEQQYRLLQSLGEFDLKTSSWIQTPSNIRKLGGALFCDRRYDHVFVYHNGAQSYYAARGFRGVLKL